MNEKHAFCYYIIAIFIYFLAVGSQGLDMCDEGWVMTGYQQLFNDADSVTYQLLYYTTLLVGAVWNKLFGWLGYYGFRILSAIVLTATCAVIYKTLKPHVSRVSIIIGTILCISFSNYGVFVFHHNHLTIFFISLACYLLMMGLNSCKSSNYFLIAGICVGINVFSRLPNLTMCALIVSLFPLYATISRFYRSLGFCVFGFVLGVLLILVLMSSLDHLDTFVSAIKMMQAASNDPLSTHDLSYMLGVYAGNYKIVVASTIIILVMSFARNYIVRFMNNRMQTITFCVLVVLSCLLYYKFNPLFVVYGLTTVILCFALYKYKEDKKLLSLILMALVWLHFLPVGSDFGIGNMGGSSVWLAIPLALGIVHKELETKDMFAKLSWLHLLAAVMIVPFFINIKTIFGQCYFDKGSRFEKTYQIDNAKLNTFTTKNNKELLEPLLKELPKYVNKGEYLLQYMKCPLIHYITETRPCLGNSWVWASTPGLIQEGLQKVELSGRNLPVIVREKSAIGQWYNYDETWNNDNAKNTYEHKNEKITIIKDFISRNDYHIVWENEIFQILKTDK